MTSEMCQPVYGIIRNVIFSPVSTDTFPDGEIIPLAPASARIVYAGISMTACFAAVFPSDSVTSVIAQPGQFSTYRRSSGTSCVSGTVYSDEAIVRAYEWIQSGEEYPEVLFFNCRGWNMGEPYGDSTYGGNYFMTYGGIQTDD